MAGLGLKDALRSYTEGVAWQQNQAKLERIAAQQAALDEANKVGTQVINQEKEQWAMRGAPGEFRPSSETMFRAAEARGSALAKAGQWDAYLANEASIVPMRLRARSEALQQYQMDGDVEQLARKVYPTIFDGKTITGVEKLEGADAVAGLAAIKPKLKLKLSDGTEHSLDPTEFVGHVKLSLDPEALKREAKLNFERTKTEIETAGKVRVEEAKGDQARKTEGVKGENAKGLAAVKFGYDQQLHAADNASREKVAQGNNSATRDAAATNAGARVKAARIGAGGKEGDTDKRVKNFKEIHDQVTRIVGMPQQGLMGGNKVSDEQTMAIARGAQAVLQDDPSIDVGAAIQKSITEWKKRGGKRPVPLGQTLTEEATAQ